MIAQLNHMAQIWCVWMSGMFWQVSLLIILVTLLDMAIRRWAWPQVRYVLWGLVFIKLIIPPAWQMPTSIVSWIQPKVERRISIHIEPGSLITAPLQQASLSSMVQQEKGTPQPITPRLNRKSFAFLFWFAGMIAFSLMLFLKMSRLPKRHKAQTQGIAPEWFDDIFDKTSQRLKLRKKPIVIFSKDAKIPAVYGLFRPVLLLPDRYFDQFFKEQAGHVLMHELCHLKRGDLIVHWFCIILQGFYWFNPLLIWTRRQMRHVCEICCDLSVADILREKTADYRNTLLESTCKLLTETVQPGLGLLGVFEEPFRIASRLEWLEKKTWENRKRKMVAAIVIGLIMVIFVMPMAGRSQSIEQRALSSAFPVEKAKTVDTGAGLSDKDAELIGAAFKGDLAAVSAALANGADVNAKNNKGLTALMKASAGGHADVVKFLLDKGADVNSKNTNGYTALMAASWSGHADVVKLLLDRGVDVKAKDIEGGTALMGASWAGHADVVKLLLDKGADVNAKDNKGITVLMHASAGVYADKVEVVKLLLDKGADINAKDTEGRTALTSVGTRDHAAIAQLLKEAGGIVSGDDLAQSNLRNAVVAQEAYWVDNQTYTDSLDKLVGTQYGLNIDKGVTLRIISAGKDQYHMIAFDKQGNKKYQINGPGGKIEEYLK